MWRIDFAVANGGHYGHVTESDALGVTSVASRYQLLPVNKGVKNKSLVLFRAMNICPPQEYDLGLQLIQERDTVTAKETIKETWPSVL